MLRPFSAFWAVSLLTLGLLPARGLADQTLQTSGFDLCLTSSDITVQNLNIEYNNDQKTVTFDVAGTSTKSMNVTAQLNVTAYGIMPSGTFTATGVQTIPSAYATMIPSIAFSIPDIAAQATLQLKSRDTGDDVACITSDVSNGKTASIPAVSYVVAGIAGAAVLVTGATALGAASAGGSTAGTGTMSPSFTEVFTFFQGVAMNGMLSVQYPPVYRAFTKNFAFSTGLIPWTAMQTSIDNFRQMTGGNLTDDSVAYLQNATLTYGDGSTSSTSSSILRRALIEGGLLMRDSLSTDVNSTATSSSAANSTTSSFQTTVSGIKAYAEQLTVPQANTFMTVLLIAAIVIAAISVGILLFKVILEIWALFASFPEGLTGFRKHYWGTMARTIVNLILVLYGIWVLYCIFQFTHGDSWAAKALAGVTLALFTGVLCYFVFMIWKTARDLKKAEGDVSGLYEDKQNWLKYSLFYESYKKDFWWLFIPAIVYMFAKGCVLAAADGHGLAQTIAQLVIECLMLGLLVWNRPYERKSGNVINIFIQVVRALSVVCILVFVEELGIAQTTQTITGVVLIVVQSVLTGLLAILIAVNALILCCKENPHRKRRKELEKLRDLDNLTPLDARNTLLVDPGKMNTVYDSDPKQQLMKENSFDSFTNEPANPYAGATPLRSYTGMTRRGNGSVSSTENLVEGAAPLGGRENTFRQEPTVPNIPGYSGYRGVAY
ncbi:hypothetical protein B7494_g2141 [Chlorociboria aeruginascens]|nr:hypothetical protein B7494_g2141 [Chlorociboria aeruginascens]